MYITRLQDIIESQKGNHARI